MSKLSVTLVYNRASGSAMDLPMLRELFAARDIEIDNAIAVGAGFEHQLHAPIKNGATIAVVGGDGTISTVAGLVAGTQAVLLPLPGGTLNNFTKDLDVPQDVGEALDYALSAKVRTVDIASVNDRRFVNNSSIGLYPESLRTRRRAEDRLGKWPAALVGVFRAFVRFRMYDIAIDDETFRTPFVFVGNNVYQLEGMAATGRERLDAGTLCVYIVKAQTRLALARLFVAALFGKLRAQGSFEYRTTNSITIQSHRHRAVHVAHDGELSRVQLPITYRIHAGDLRVRG